MIPLHLGAMHPYERILVLVLAIGPFVILGVVIWIRTRQDAAAAAGETGDGADGADDLSD